MDTVTGYDWVKVVRSDVPKAICTISPDAYVPSAVGYSLISYHIGRRMKGTMKLKMSKYEKLCLTSNKRTYFKHKISLVFSSWAVSYFPL